MQDRKLYVIYDALCCWTYGALPLLERLTEHCLAQGESLELIPFGHAADPQGAFLTPQKADQCWHNCQRVADLSGQPFSDNYRRQILEKPGKQLDPTWILQGFSLLPATDLRQHLLFGQTLLKARYLEGRDTTQKEEVQALLTDMGVAEEIIHQLGSDVMAAAAQQLRKRAQELLLQADNRGLPSFLLQTQETVLKMDHHPFLQRPEAFVPFVDKTITAMVSHNPPLSH